MVLKINSMYILFNIKSSYHCFLYLLTIFFRLFSLLIFTSLYIRADNLVNLSSTIFALKQVLSSLREKKLLSAVTTEISDLAKILRNYVCIV